MSHIINLAAKEQNKKLHSINNNFEATLKVTGSGAYGSSNFVQFITDNSNHLFNCSEGTQRLCQEHRFKLSKLRNIFLTSLSWNNVGGLAGILLTAQADGLKSLNIHSPEGIQTYVQRVQNMTNMPTLRISYPSVDENDTYKDNTVKVTYVHIKKSLKIIEKCIVDEQQYSSNVNGKRIIHEKEKTNAEKKIKSSPNVICYICEVKGKPGKLLISKCIEFGIPPGPLFTMLKEGLNVTKKDGTIVHSSDVREPNSPKTTFIVADCPTEEYLDSFINHPSFSTYQQPILEEEEEKDVCCICHFTPEEIFNDQRYQNWIEKFSSKTTHILFNNKNTCFGSEAIYKNQYLMNMLHPEIFPLLPKNDIGNDKIKDNIYRARGIQLLKIRPRNDIIHEEIHKKPEEYINTILQIQNFQDVLNDLQGNIDEMSTKFNLNNTPEYPRILMLGTGCSVPNKVRNTSSILIRIDKNNSILLDCGEATLGQIVRFYGSSESNNILRTIKAIYVSHIHTDHHLGLIGLLLRRKQITNDKLYLLVPQSLLSWLNFYNDQFESISQQYTLVDNVNLYMDRHKIPEDFERKLLNNLNIKAIDTVFVTHCKMSYGIAITFNDNKKIVYSGDTMFSSNLVQLGANCDLLIHEATLEDGLEELAKRKLHSTTSEAIKAGQIMRAKFILLTHFSQRYSKIPSIPKINNVGIAYDYMQFKLSQLQLLPLFHPCIKLMFEQYNIVHTNDDNN